mmetsp:Transcript_66215/g.137982  ORF Transcript_66215/g.137982 Transcript_66215/m.137982 type:complete len:230 (+) Transcript_66215:244-933(+)
MILLCTHVSRESSALEACPSEEGEEGAARCELCTLPSLPCSKTCSKIVDCPSTLGGDGLETPLGLPRFRSFTGTTPPGVAVESGAPAPAVAVESGTPAPAAFSSSVQWGEVTSTQERRPQMSRMVRSPTSNFLARARLILAVGPKELFCPERHGRLRKISTTNSLLSFGRRGSRKRWLESWVFCWCSAAEHGLEIFIYQVEQSVKLRAAFVWMVVLRREGGFVHEVNKC